jgi:hypothetical protein
MWHHHSDHVKFKLKMDGSMRWTVSDPTTLILLFSSVLCPKGITIFYYFAWTYRYDLRGMRLFDTFTTIILHS